MKTLVNAAVRRPVSTVMVFLGVALACALTASTLGIAEFPDVRVPKLVVSTAYPGLPAQEVRQLLTLPLEDSLASARGLRHLESISREGVSTVTVEFQWGTDLGAAGAELREVLGASRQRLPADARPPLVLPADPADEPLAVLAVVPKNGDLALAKRLASKDIRARLQRIRGVGAVVAAGGLDEEILVEADRARLVSRGLTLPEFARALSASNYDYPAGTLTEGSSELVVKTQGTVKKPEALAALRIGGVPVSEIASIRFAEAEPTSVFSTGGMPGVGLLVHRQPGASPVATAEALKTETRQLAQDYGRDLDISLVFDGTASLRQSLTALAFDVLAGALIAFAVVWIFVRDGPTSLIVVLTIPVAILLTLAVLKLCGRTLNLLSVGGLALSIGMMVDHTVVVLESLHRTSGSAKTASTVCEATVALSLSNTGATGTAVIVFLPIVFLPGAIGGLFADLSLAVMAAHLSSFLVSVTLVPALFLLFPTRFRPPRFLGALEARYRRILTAAFRRPKRVGVGVSAMLLVGVALLPGLRFEIFPASDEGLVEIRTTLPPGTGLAAAGAVAREYEVQLSAAGFPRTYSRAGGDDDDAYFRADPNESREVLHTRVLVAQGSAEPSLRRIRDAFPEPETEVFVPPHPLLRLLGGGLGGAFVVLGSQPSAVRDRLAEIRAQRSDLVLRAFPEGIRPEVRFQPDRPALARTGADLSEVAEVLRGGLDGISATQVVVAGRDVDVRVRMRAADRASLEAIKRFPVRDKEGALQTVGELGALTEAQGEAAFYRYDRSDAVIVAAPRLWREERPDIEVPSEENAREHAAAFTVVFALVIVLLYLFLGAQLGAFGLPLVLLAAVPLSFTGVVAALAAGGVSVSAASMLGVVALFGTVINNSLLLFQACRGPGALSVLEGSLSRLRPILMTAAITALSLLPLALHARSSAEGGMALAVVGGLSVSTVMTLIVVPLLFARKTG